MHADNCSEALSLFMHAASKNDFLGCGCLARCFDYGMGVEVDIARALELYQCAADQGDIESMKALADKFRFDQQLALHVVWLAKHVVLSDSSSEAGISDIFRDPLAWMNCGQLDANDVLAWQLISFLDVKCWITKKCVPK